jgi:hypothetical protein
MKQITRIGALVGLLAFSSAAVLKQGDGFLQEKNLAQASVGQVRESMDFGGDPCTGGLNAGRLEALESEVEAGRSTT